MDTNRIIINNYDLSTATIEEATTYSGFTVVDAEKGPIHPVRISANDKAKIQDVFGLASKDYPELYEVQSFNTDYDVYVSAPYSEAKVPVAYITKDGIFVGENNVTYDANLEKLIFGENDTDVNVPGITSVGTSTNPVVNVKVSTSRPKDVFALGNNIPSGIPEVSFLQGNTSENPLGQTAALRVYTGLTTKMEYAYTEVLAGDLYDAETSYYKKDTTNHIVPATVTADSYFKRVKDDYFLAPEVEGEDYIPAGGSVYDSTKAYYKYDEPNYVAVPTSEVGNIYNEVFKAEALPLYIRASEEKASVIHAFELLVDEGKVTGLKIDSDRPILVLPTVKPVQVADGAGGTAETDEIFVEWRQNESTDVCICANNYIYIPLTSEQTSWYAESTNLETATASWLMSIGNNDIVGTIFPKYPSERALHLEFEAFNSSRGYSSMTSYGRNIIKFSAYEKGAFHDKAHKVSVIGSLDPYAKDANGGYLAFSDKNVSYSDQELVAVYSKGGFEKIDTTFKAIEKYADITLKGGVRKKAVDHSKGWAEAKKSEYSRVDVFFDSKRHDTPASLDITFLGLASEKKLAGFIFNYTVEDPTSVPGQLSYGPNYWNICNEAVIVLDNNTRILSPMTGARAKMQVRIIENRWGGIAPMFLNSGTPSMGGQIDINPLRLRFRYTKDQQDKFDNLNMNPAILDHTYGVYLTGQKTCKAGELTDWSYIGHVSAFLAFEKEVWTNVMFPQLGKANNDYYRTLRKQQVEGILSKRLSGTNRIWAAATVDTSTADGCNDTAARRAKKFIINVKVKVNVFSETVELNFTNVDQSMEI